MTPQDRFQEELARLAAEEAERPAIQAKGVEALQRLLPVAQRCTGQSRIVGRFLLSLYNGNAFPFSLTDLRGLDSGLWDDCLAVLRLDRRPEQEVHEYIENGDQIWSHLKRAWA
ncbi:DUF7673 family protein [Pseudomonas aeruginosa]|uniref:DUF7673 family protein n=1 Tax=Pseudomonas aeruginosa TaxID=287 RepID=UPI00071B118A|nr:hypothetical protein [Pseudomonas aeruginosa]